MREGDCPPRSRLAWGPARKPCGLRAEEGGERQPADPRAGRSEKRAELAQVSGCSPLERTPGPASLPDDNAEKGDEKDPTVVAQREEPPAEEDLLGPNCYYDKSKSFFDNISSELKSSSRRTTWAEERKLNTETFGVSGRFLRGRSARGGFRGGRGNGTARRNPTSHRAGTGRV